MTQVAFNGHEARFTDTMDPFASLPRLGSAPRIEMMANPDFVFPRTAPSPAGEQSLGPNQRPQSFHANHSGRTAPEHRRAKSTMPLPSFSFNAADTTGLLPNAPQVGSTNELAPSTPSRGHKRTTSEFVGGDSRLLASAAVVSPLSTASQPLQISTRPNHRHRRSAAISSHDVRDIMSPPEPMPRLSCSAPNSPMEELQRPNFGGEDLSASSSGDESSTRPPSRRQVEFSDTVEFIPRPLSTISSGTEGSYSTARGHSVNNSISSMLSLGTTPSPPVNRIALVPLETTLECEPDLATRSSLEINRRVEKEGQWLKCSPRDSDVPQMAESPTTTISFADPESPIKPRPSHRAKDSRQLATEIERRRSEPTVKALDEAGLSNLQTTKSQDLAAELAADSCIADRRSSTRKLKDWAMAKMIRTPGKKHARGQSEIVSPFRSCNRNSRVIPNAIMIPAPVAETDLDAVFGGPTSPRAATSTVYSRLGNLTPTFTPSASQSSLGRSIPAEDDGMMLDLDAALGPFQTPTMGTHKRREMHSSRLNRDFTGPGGHYLPNPNHRRTESAPMLTPFDNSRVTTPAQPAMADVFEEDEEEDAGRRASAQSLPEDEAAIGIQIVDADVSAPPSRNHGLSGRSDEGAEWEPDRPSPSIVSYLSSGLSTPTVEHRPSSIVEETIMEEPSPVEPVSPLEPVQIVPDYEDPRAPSFTKSSDSSETPTLLAGSTTIPNRPMTSPEYNAYGTPPPFAPPPELLCGRGQSSFDTPRVGTSASSVTTADGRTMSSYATGEGSSSEPRRSVDDVPSLTSSRSTMLSTMQAFPRREGSESRPPYPALNARAAAANVANYAQAMPPSPMDEDTTASRRRKRQSIQSLSQLVGVASFGGSARSSSMTAASSSSLTRPQTADVLGGRFRASPSPPQSSSSFLSTASTRTGNRKPVEHRLKKLMFWKSKSRQSLNSLASNS